MTLPSLSALWKLRSRPPSFPTGKRTCGDPVSSRCFAFSGLPMRVPMNVPDLSRSVMGEKVLMSSTIDFPGRRCCLCSLGLWSSMPKSVQMMRACSLSKTINSLLTNVWGVPMSSRDRFASCLGMTIFSIPFSLVWTFAWSNQSRSWENCSSVMRFQ